MPIFDIVIVGAGAAGLSLAYQLARQYRSGRGDLRVALVEPPPGPQRPDERTWCFWERGAGPWDSILAARWNRLAVIAPSGRRSGSDINPLSYKMLRSAEFDRHVRSTLGAGVAQHRATVSGIEDGADRAVVHAHGSGGVPVRLGARWVFDSRPSLCVPPAHTTLLQHFRGWFVRTEADEFDPGEAVLMDLRLRQPRAGLAFGYVLPLSQREALVEYTEFTRAVLDDAGYDAALRHYTANVLGLGAFTVTASEQGVIPMTDARFATRVGARTFRIGAAGGATRPSTGYAFSAVQRQAASIVEALERGRVPAPRIPHRRRHLAMDAVLLRGLDTGRVDGAAFFTRLFERNRTRDVLAFLDGRSSLLRELALGWSAPLVPMSLAGAERGLMSLRPPRRTL